MHKTQDPIIEICGAEIAYSVSGNGEMIETLGSARLQNGKNITEKEIVPFHPPLYILYLVDLDDL